MKQATGAGKTFTISKRFISLISLLTTNDWYKVGTPSNPGIMPLTMVELFKRIDQCANEKLTKVSVSFLEVYNETVRDLLATTDNGASLEIREDSANRISVPGLSEHHPSNEAEVMELLDRGASNRICSATGANEVSSRSHAVFQINIQQRDRIPGLETQVKVATLTLCDLAGSERASATENRGQLLREGANINR
jgi:kinesin family protein 18/19